MYHPTLPSHAIGCHVVPEAGRLLVATSVVAIALLSQSLAAQESPTQAGCAAAAAYSEKQEGLAVLVLHKGKVIFEKYAGGHARKKVHHIFSGTKSFAPMVALIAQSEGLLELDELVCKTIPEWADDPRKKQITIRHLLSFTSGISQKGGYAAPDLYRLAVNAKAEQTPGTRFRYGSNHLRVFGELLKRKLAAASAEAVAETDEPTESKRDAKKPPVDFVGYLEDRILGPIGMNYGYWIRDRSKNPALSYGAFLTAREWSKFGQLVLQKGKWGDRQVIPASQLSECFSGSKANPTYGLNWWLIGPATHRRRPAVPKDTVAAKGMYHQLLYVIPSAELVVVRFGKLRTRVRFSDAEFLGRLLETTDKVESSPKKVRRKIE